LGATQYGPAIDLWSSGCILAELLLRKPILPGRNEYEQLDLVFKLLGTPTEEVWPGWTKQPYYDMAMAQSAGRHYESRFDEKFASLEPMAKDLLRKLLAMDPAQRITARDALDHDYFWTHPLPTKPEDLPKYPACHEFTAKKRRQQQAAQSVPPSGAAPQPHPQRTQYGAPQGQCHHYQTQHHHQQQPVSQFAPGYGTSTAGVKRGRPGGYDPNERGPLPVGTGRGGPAPHSYGQAVPPQQQHQGRPAGFANGSYGR